MLRHIRNFSSFRANLAPAALDFSKLKITKATTSKSLPDPKELVFGRFFADHMLTCEWDIENGWGTPEIKPYQNLSLDPSSSVFHYGFECFEGMKAYKDEQGKVLLFRPDKNMERMNKSTERICLPTFDGETMTKLLAELVKTDAHLIPQLPGYSMYLRPTMIGTQATLGVAAPNRALFFCIASPVGPYYASGFKAVSLEATDYAVRAWPGGVGDKKLGANYAPCVKPQREAASRGYAQNLWLFGEDRRLTEVGTMNLFVVFKHEDGTKELVTAPLDGTILEGVTRDSILQLARERLPDSGWKVSERYCTINEVIEAANSGNLVEAFGSGTAAVVSPIKSIGYHGETINVPLQDGKEAGPLTEEVAKWIADIQYGRESHPWGVYI